MTTSPSLSVRALRALAFVSVVGLGAACTTGSSPSPSTSLGPPSQAPASAPASSSASASSAASEAPSGSQAAQGTAVATAIDPCQLVTAGEASQLTGATFTAGQESTDANNVKTCTYGQQGVALTVLAAEAPDEATAKQNEADAKADLAKNAPGLPITVEELPGFAPGADATVISGSMGTGGQTFSGIAIYVVKGKDFFGITDIATGSQAPTSDQMQDQAKVALSRLP
jgi:hypothetical protein